MEKDVSSAILALANDPENLSITAQIRASYPAILQAKKAGVSNQKIVLELNAQGIAIDLKGFVNALYRLKKEGAINSPTHSPTPAKPPALFNDFVKPTTFKRTERP